MARLSHNEYQRRWRTEHRTQVMLVITKDDAEAWRSLRRVARTLGLSVGETLLLGWPVLMRRAVRSGIDPRELPVRVVKKTAPPPRNGPRIREVRPR